VRRVFRYVVPADDQEHSFKLTRGDMARILHVDGSLYHVEFWAENNDEFPEEEVTFRAFGTGHLLPENARYAGTTSRTPEGLVWHLYKVDKK
jgi:hypothetical protein